MGLFNIANLLKGFGPTGGGSTDPNIVTITVADNADGTGGVATLSGSTGGATNNVYVSADSPISFSLAGTRSGDGTVALSLVAGDYLAYVDSVVGSLSSRSAPYEFTTTLIATANMAPAIWTGNTFEPVQFCKCPNGDIIWVNGIDHGGMWEGLAPLAYNLGIAAPLTAPVIAAINGAGGATAGTYNFYYRYTDFLGRHSSLSPVTSFNAADLDEFTWSVSLPVETTRVTNIELWRTLSGGANVLLLVAVLPATQATYLVDSATDLALENIADEDPTTRMQVFNDDGSPDAERFTPPPTNKKSVVWFQSRAFYAGDVKYTAGTASVINGSTTVNGVGTNWPSTFGALVGRSAESAEGRYFYGANAPRGYEIATAQAIANNVVLVTAGSPPLNEIQTITVPTATGGTFTVTLGASTSAANAYNISAATLQTNLRAMTSIGAGNCSVSLAAGVYTVTFISGKANTNIAQMTADGTLLSGAAAVVTTLVNGGATGGGGGGVSQCGFFGFIPLLTAAGSAASLASPRINGGQFTLTFNGHTTAPINVTPGSYPTAANLKPILEGLASIGTGNIAVYDSSNTNVNMSWQYCFQGALQGLALPIISTNTAPVPPSSGVRFDYEGTGNSYLNVVDQIINVGGGGGSGGGGTTVNEVQEITLPAGASGGTFTITTNTFTTAAIAWNASAATVQAALVAACGAGTFSVSKPAAGQWILTFTGTFGGINQSPVVVTTTALTGATVSTATTVDGNPGTSGVQSLILGNPTSGTFTLTYGANTTAAIAYNASAATIQTALTGLASVGGGNATVAATATPGTFTITFTGTLANTAVTLIVADTSLLVGATQLSQLTLVTPYLGATASGMSYMIRPSPDERNQGYYSIDSEPESVPSTNTWKVQTFTARDDEVQGLMVYSGFMYVLMNYHILRYDYSNDPKFDGSDVLAAMRGVFNKRCADTMGDVAFFMDEQGAYAMMPNRQLGGNALAQVQPLDDAIQNYWREGLIDFTKVAAFWVKCDPLIGVVHFAVCLVGDTSNYPRWTLTFNPDHGVWWLTKWHEPMAHAAEFPLGNYRRLLLGGASGYVHVHGDSNADGIDTDTEMGTLTGTVTSATANTLTDSTATFTSTMVGAPVAIISGTGKGQTATVQSQSAHQLVFTTNWTTTPDTTSVYLVGAIQWSFKTGLLKYLLNVPKDDMQLERDLARAIRVSWQPTAHSCLMDIRKFSNNNTSPDTFYGNYQDGSGLTIVDGDTSATQDMLSSLDQAEGATIQAVGFTRLQFDSGAEDKSIVDRWLSAYVTGYASRDRVTVFAVEIEGATAGGK